MSKQQWFQRSDFLESLFDTIPSLLFIVDQDLNITHLNAAALKFATDEEQNSMRRHRGGDFLHCIHSFEAAGGCGRSPHCSDCVIRRSVGRSFEGEHIHRETAGMTLVMEGGLREVCFLITTSPFHYHGENFALLVMEDITEQKHFEEALREHAARLEASYKDMESFSYSASHDLRSPLIAISGFARILMEDHSDKLDEKARELLGIIGKNAKRMERLLSDLLQFSRLSTKEVKQHEVKIDMEKLAREAYEELKPAAGEKKVLIDIRHMPPASGDRSMLRQVLINLLSNALKYSRSDDTMKIEVGGGEEGNEVVFYVRDNGVGFDMKYAHRLFGLFSRLHHSDKFEGTGIGLVIIKRIIEKHGGRVWAEAKPNQGATFYFALPRD